MCRDRGHNKERHSLKRWLESYILVTNPGNLCEMILNTRPRRGQSKLKAVVEPFREQTRGLLGSFERLQAVRSFMSAPGINL